MNKTAAILGGVSALIAGAAAWIFVVDRPTEQTPPSGETKREFNPAVVRGQVARFCGDCHAVPSPQTFPKDAWYEEVDQGYAFYRESGRTDLDVPPMSDVVAWYRSQAPPTLKVTAETGSPSPVRFRRVSLPLPAPSRSPAVAFLTWARMSGNGSRRLLFCDMLGGDIRKIVPRGSNPRTREYAVLDNPAHVEPCDLDGDGTQDLLVADLGSFQPADHDKGRVVRLRQRPGSAEWNPVVLQEHLGRVADVRPGDFDGDGDTDLVVAEFGWRKTGRILLLERRDGSERMPQFDRRVLDDRHGTIHVPPADVNGDGALDFIALISQEHETVVAFLNRGDGTFRTETIFEAGDPSYGSSGIQLVDLDEDGDRDVLYTNGDSLDAHYVKPYHAIHWLENRGSYPFAHHELTRMPGVSRAMAGDIDGDGDLDVAACAYIPASLLGGQAGEAYDSLIWLERTATHEFTRHRLERSDRGHLALEIGDFDADGDNDLVVGNHTKADPSETEWLSLWWNEGEG